jgi:hypothetical protein
MGSIMSDETVLSEGSSFAPKHVKKTHFVGVFFLILLIVIALLLGLYFFGASKNPSAPVQKPSPTPTLAPAVSPTHTPTPTAVPFNRGDLTVTVLNGSGVSGAAQGTSTKLRNLGYTVKTVGNATRFDYEGLTVNVTKEHSKELELIKKDLSDDGTTVTTGIDDTITTDVEVIVGK